MNGKETSFKIQDNIHRLKAENFFKPIDLYLNFTILIIL